MSSFLGSLRKQKSTPRSCRHRRLRAEALEKRLVLAPVAALPVSVVLLSSPSGSATPPDPCIQFNPQPILSEVLLSGAGATSSMPVRWQGHFTEQLLEPFSTAASPTPGTSVAAPAGWLVDGVYNLNGQLPADNAGVIFDVSGTARETLTPVDASGQPISTAQSWVSTDKINWHFSFSGYFQFPSATFRFTSDTTINQTLTPIAATAVTTPQSWIATMTSHATGTIREVFSPAADPTVSPQIKGSISLQDQINATLSPAVPPDSTVPVTEPWQISATFIGSGDFNETLSPPATTAIVAGPPSGTLGLTGTLSETITPPGTTVTLLLKSPVVASVSFWATPDPSATSSS